MDIVEKDKAKRSLLFKKAKEIFDSKVGKEIRKKLKSTVRIGRTRREKKQKWLLNYQKQLEHQNI